MLGLDDAMRVVRVAIRIDREGARLVVHDRFHVIGGENSTPDRGKLRR